MSRTRARIDEPAARVRTADAARLTGLDARTLQEKAAAGLIPGARKLFGRWTYDARELERLGNEPCRKASIKGAHGGGRVSRSQASHIESRYESLFAGSRKNA
jgi:hypothetical protein